MPFEPSRYQRAEQFLPATVLKRIYNWRVYPQWIGADQDTFSYRRHTRRGHEFFFVDPAQRQKRPAFDHARLAQALSEQLGQPVDPFALPFERIQFTADGQSIEFAIANELGDRHLRCDLRDYTLTAGNPPLAAHELLSPDSQYTVHVEEFNLWLHHLPTDERRQLTFDGVQHFAYGMEPGGTMQDVTEAISGYRPPPSVMWSPDGRKLLVYRVDERAVKTMYLLQSVTETERYRPKLHPYKVPLLEDDEQAIGGYIILDISSGAQTPVQLPPIQNSESLFYWKRLGMQMPPLWRADSQRLYLHLAGPSGLSQSLYEIDPITGSSRVVIEERAATPVYLNLFQFNNPNYRILSASNEVIWFSERTGWAHLYLYDLTTGECKGQITAGEWVVRDILQVDEAQRQIYFTAGGVDASLDPYYRHLYRINFDGSGLTLLSPEAAEHLITPSPNGQTFIDSYSQVNVPPVTVVRDRAGRELLRLEEADVRDLLATGFRYPEPFQTLADDGVTPIYGVVYFPSNFDPQRKYPVIDAIYGGPQLTVVPKAFPWSTGTMHDLATDNAIEDYWLPQATAELGFIVVVIDGMGTPYRSRDFHDVAFHNPANGGGLADHVAALRQLAAARPYLDLDHVGIFGHSAGGDNAAKALLLFPDFFHVAVSSAGAHEMRAYAADWAAHGTDFARLTGQANSRYAANLKGKLFLVTGDMDENCHPLHTWRLVDALIKADKDFDLLVLPNRNHGFTLEPYFIRRRWDYFVRHLLGEEPRRD